ERREYRIVELVAAVHRAIGAEQRRARERQIADGIQHLVTDELVPKTQTLRIEHAIFGDDERILQRGAERISGAPQLGDVTHEAERPRPRDLTTEGVGSHIKGERLLPD